MVNARSSFTSSILKDSLFPTPSISFANFIPFTCPESILPMVMNGDLKARVSLLYDLILQGMISWFFRCSSSGKVLVSKVGLANKSLLRSTRASTASDSRTGFLAPSNFQLRGELEAENESCPCRRPETQKSLSLSWFCSFFLFSGGKEESRSVDAPESVQATGFSANAVCNVT